MQSNLSKPAPSQPAYISLVAELLELYEYALSQPMKPFVRSVMQERYDKLKAITIEKIDPADVCDELMRAKHHGQEIFVRIRPEELS